MHICKKSSTFAPKIEKEALMVDTHFIAELFRNLAIIAEDEKQLRKVAKYVRRLAKQMTDDPALQK